MPAGPIDLIVVSFPGNKAPLEVAEELKDLISKSIIRVIDILFIEKDQQGCVTTREIDELDDEQFTSLDPLIADIEGLFSNEDIQKIAASLDPNTSAGVMLFENTWAMRFRDAVDQAQGKVLFNERIPEKVIDQVMAASASPGRMM